MSLPRSFCYFPCLGDSMDGAADSAGDCSQRGNKRPLKDFLTDSEEAALFAAQSGVKRHHKDPKGLMEIQRIGCHNADSSGLLPDDPVQVSQDRWTVSGQGGGKESPNSSSEYLKCPEDQPHNSRSNSPPIPPPAPDKQSCASCAVWDGPTCTSRSPCCAEQDPVRAAAHLHLLGESLTLIGLHLQETNKKVCMWRSFSLLLDSLLCAMAPLISLTTQVPELRGCTQHTMPSTLENIAYMMPGL